MIAPLENKLTKISIIDVNINGCWKHQFWQKMSILTKISIWRKFQFEENVNFDESVNFDKNKNFDENIYFERWHFHQEMIKMSKKNLSVPLNYNSAVFVFVFVILFVFLWIRTCPFITLIRCLEGMKTIILFVCQLVKSLVSESVTKSPIELSLRTEDSY